MARDGDLDRFLAWRQVRELTGLGRTTAWRLRRTGDFPQPVHLSPGRVAWRERDIAAWNESRCIPTPTPAPATQSPTAPGAPTDGPRAARAPTAAPAQEPVAGSPEPTSPPAPDLGRRRRSGVAEGQLCLDF